MGAELAKLSGKSVGENRGNDLPVRPAAAPARPGAADRNSAARTPAARPAADARGSEPRADGGKAPAEKEGLSGLAVLNGAPPTPATPQKKQQRKPRAAKKKEPDNSFTADQITALIVALSSIFASRPGMEMFMITDTEAATIAKPLSNIIAKNENLAGLGEHADGIALVTACIVVMLPRFMLYMEAQKQKKLAASGGAKLVRTDKQNDGGQSRGNDRKSAGVSTQQPANDADGIFAVLPAVL